jgi:hypothetical protein
MIGAGPVVTGDVPPLAIVTGTSRASSVTRGLVRLPPKPWRPPYLVLRSEKVDSADYIRDSSEFLQLAQATKNDRP